MRQFLLGAAAAIAFVAPAHAVLQFAAQIGPDSFFCADGQACDTSGVANLITTNNAILDGILFTSSSASSASGGVDFLNASNLLITNTTHAMVTLTLAVSNTGFTTPIAQFSSADSGVWQGAGGSAALMKWFVDPADAQGANNAFDVPGTQIDSSLSTSVGPVLAFSRNSPTIFKSLDSPFSMTEQMTLTLAPGESLVNRGQTIIAIPSAVIPETSTWAMTGLGFALIAGLGWKRRGARLASRALIAGFKTP